MSRITCGSTTARSIRTGGADLRGEDIGQGHRAWNQSLLVEVADQALDRGPEMYRTFRDKQDGCVKVVLKPGMR